MFTIENQLKSYDYDYNPDLEIDRDILSCISKGFIYYDPFKKTLSMTIKGEKYFNKHFKNSS